MPVLGHINNLIGIVVDLLEREAACGEATAEDFLDLAARLRALPVDRIARQPTRLPAARYWEDTLALADGAPAGGNNSPYPGTVLAAALRPLGPALAWIQNPNYTVENIGAAFVANYCYADVASPRGLIATDTIALGVLLIGPGMIYPPHAHPALEIYCVVGGEAEWQRGDGPWVRKPAGTVIHHPPGIVHATRTGSDPLLALYLWRGHLDTAAELTGEE